MTIFLCIFMPLVLWFVGGRLFTWCLESGNRRYNRKHYPRPRRR